jgi:hypothetical protein
VTDENPKTFWVAAENRPAQWTQVDLGRIYDVKAIQVNFADYKSGLFANDSNVVYTQFNIRASADGQNWMTVADLSGSKRDRPNAYLEITPTRARYIRYEHKYVGAANLAISDIRVFGNGPGTRPATPTQLSARRERDERNAIISWRAVPGAVGYNVRWGIAPDKLHSTYQRWADQGTQLELRALTTGQRYWVAIESFDENGVSALSTVVPIR